MPVTANTSASAGEHLARIETALEQGQYDLAQRHHRIAQALTGSVSPPVACGRIVSAREFAQETGAPYHILKERQPIRPGRIPRISGRCILLGDAQTGEANEQYVAVVPRATIFGKNNIVLAGENTFISDYMTHPLARGIDFTLKTRVLHWHGYSAIVDVSCRERLRLPRAFMLSGVASSSFGHWLSEYMPRLDMLTRLKAFDEWPVVVDEGMPESHYEMLALALKDKRQIVRIAPDQAVDVDELALAPSLTFTPWGVTARTVYSGALFANCPDHFQSLPRRFLEPCGAYTGRRPEPGTRYFISRRNAGNGLRLINEEEVVSCFRRFGFEPVFPEELSFAEQVRLFNRAEAVAGAFGSAFCLLPMFSQYSQIYICTNQHISYLWSWITKAIDLPEGYNITLLCGFADGEFPPESFRCKTLPFSMNIPLIERVLAGDFQ